MAIDPGTFVVVRVPAITRLFYARVLGPMGTQLRVLFPGGVVGSNITVGNVRVLPNNQVATAKAILLQGNGIDIKAVLELCEALKGEVTIIVGAASIGASGAELMSGLKAITGSASCSILFLALGAAETGVKVLNSICEKVENDKTTKNVTKVCGCIATVFSSGVALIAVAKAGAVSGLSASGITSGLATLGGGSIASGGFGMAGGLLVVTGGAAALALAVTGICWFITNAFRQSTLTGDYNQFVTTWQQAGYTGP